MNVNDGFIDAPESLEEVLMNIEWFLLFQKFYEHHIFRSNFIYQFFII